MKIFFSKFRKCHFAYKFFYIVALLLYWISFGFFVRSVLLLEGIETVIRTIILVFFGIFGILYTLFGLTKMFQNKKVGFIFLTLFALVFSGVFGFATFSIQKIYGKIENFTSKETSTYTTVLLGLTGTTFDSNSTIGMITNEEDRTGYILPMEWMKMENINNEIEYYSSTLELLKALYNKEVDAIFITKDYPVIYANEDAYPNIVSETTILKEYSKEMKTEESEFLTTTKSLTEPFTVLVLGVDSEATNGLDANAAFNGDTLMLITFNPKTLTATMLSVPRDMYVPIYNASGTSSWYGKINSSSAYGTASTVKTMEMLTDIDIDYFVKVNFRGVIDLVNALGGVDVDVEQPDYSYYVQEYGEGRLCESDANRSMANLVCMDTGMQHLNGEQALAYARNRHGFLESDIARNRHQQQIIEAIAKKLIQNASFSDFERLLDTISNNIATNMKTSQILSFYQSIKGMLMNALSGEDFINIQKTQLTYYNLEVGGLSCLGYYPGSMAAITKAMKENLGLLEVETIKTFQYDYSEDYEQTSNIIGKGIYSGQTVQVVPSFRGKSVSQAQKFADQNDLHLSIEYKSDPSEIAGIILDQNVAAGTLTSKISSFTIIVNNPVTTKPKDDDLDQDDTDITDKDDKDDEDSNNNNSGTTTKPDDKTPSVDDDKDNDIDNNDDDEDKPSEDTTIPGGPTLDDKNDKE